MSTCAPNDRILQTLKVHVPGVTDPVLELELFNVMDEFFRRTSAWRFYQDIDLVENVYEYGFAVPGNTQIVRLLAVEHSGIQVPSAATVGAVQASVGTLAPELTFDDGDAKFHYDESDIDTQNNLFSYALYRPGFITVTALPDAEARKYPMKTCVALTVARGCLECADCGEWSLEDWMWDTFFQDWYDGTLARLYGMPAKPWSSPTIAAYHARRFRNAMAYRKQEALRGFTYNAPVWRFPRGWG